MPSSNASFEYVTKISFEQPIVIHLFSNILDIEDINLKLLADLIVQSDNRHYILCVGPIRRIERFDEFYRHFDSKYVNVLKDFKKKIFAKVIIMIYGKLVS